MTNDEARITAFGHSPPQKLYKMSHLKGKGRNMGGKNIKLPRRGERQDGMIGLENRQHGNELRFLLREPRRQNSGGTESSRNKSRVELNPSRGRLVICPGGGALWMGHSEVDRLAKASRAGGVARQGVGGGAAKVPFQEAGQKVAERLKMKQTRSDSGGREGDAHGGIFLRGGRRASQTKRPRRQHGQSRGWSGTAVESRGGGGA
jgi:hypothetical protein